LEKTRRRLKHDQLRIIFIDEASHVNSETLAIIDQRLCEITGYDEPFGGLAVILMGDFFQLPPVIPPVPLFQTVVRFFVHDANKSSLRPTTETAMRGAQLFITFQKIELTQQQRSADDLSHTKMLHKMRDFSGKHPIPLDDLEKITFLSIDDVKRDPSWADTAIITTGNNHRLTIDNFKSAEWAKRRQDVRFVWREQLQCGSQVIESEEVKQYLYTNYPEFTGFFVRHAPGYLTHNISPTRELSNGTPVRYETIVLHDNEDADEIQRKIINCEPGGDVVLDYPPKYIIVSVSNDKRKFFDGIFKEHDLLLVPIEVSDFKTYVKVRLSNKKDPTAVSIQSHPVTMSFSFTFHKVEGQTMEKVVVDVNARPFAPHLLHSGLFTAISRVRRRDNIRFMPLQPGCKDLSHLLKLRPPEELYEWLKGFGHDTAEGAEWDLERAKDAYAKKKSSNTTRRSKKKVGEKVQ